MLKEETRNQKVERQLKEVSECTLEEYSKAFTPILISRKARKNYIQEKLIDSHPYMSIGTGIYLNFAGHRWLVTANHIIVKIENELQSAPVYVRSGNDVVPLFHDMSTIPMCRFPEEDVAVIPLYKDSHCDYSDAQFIEVKNSSKFDYAEQFRIGIYGYLNKGHKTISEQIDPSQFLSKVGLLKEKETHQRVFLEFDRKNFQGDVTDQNYVPQPNGLSGGPVFGLGSVHQIQSSRLQAGVFCGLFVSQTDKGRESNASFVPMELITDCLNSTLDAYEVVK